MVHRNVLTLDNRRRALTVFVLAHPHRVQGRHGLVDDLGGLVPGNDGHRVQGLVAFRVEAFEVRPAPPGVRRSLDVVLVLAAAVMPAVQHPAHIERLEQLGMMAQLAAQRLVARIAKGSARRIAAEVANAQPGPRTLLHDEFVVDAPLGLHVAEPDQVLAVFLIVHRPLCRFFHVPVAEGPGIKKHESDRGRGDCHLGVALEEHDGGTQSATQDDRDEGHRPTGRGASQDPFGRRFARLEPQGGQQQSAENNAGGDEQTFTLFFLRSNERIEPMGSRDGQQHGCQTFVPIGFSKQLEPGQVLDEERQQR